ncbi:hypothetical protein TKK_0008498 [Trichogramma kaykai]
MTSFLTPITSLLKKLSTDGIKCTFKNNVEINVKLFVLVICVDAVARSPMQGLKQYNGNYGCGWCLHPGLYRNGCIRYVNRSNIRPRTHSRTIKLMKRLVQNDMRSKDNFGVQDVSPLIHLDSLDIIDSFVPDYMHSMLNGVGKQIADPTILLSIIQSITKSQENPS